MIFSYTSSIACEVDNISSFSISGYNQEYKYRFLKGSNPSLPVVIYLPGGPGSSSISNEDPRVSTEYGHIQTDPRGVGCNASFYKPYVNLTSEDLADDIIQIIINENLDNYILYGVSYGTALATIVADKARRDPRVNNPMTVVLEGVLGRAFTPEEEDQGSLSAWKSFLEISNEENLNSFLNSFDQLGFDGFEIGSFISNMLRHGASPEDNEHTLNMLLNTSLTGQDRIDYYSRLISHFKSGVPDDINLIRLYQQIGCEEFAMSGWSLDEYFENRNLVLKPLPKEQNICKDFPFKKGFDSKDYQIQSKVYYFNGSEDPATPLWQSGYHQENQSLADKTSINVVRGGHNSFYNNLSDCNTELWMKIINSHELNSEFLNDKCTLPITVK